MDKPLVAGIVGPTAGGKTELALRLCARLPLEIVCMDSMQVYRGMDVGTAKPGPEQRRTAPHHMLDVADPREPYSVARYAQEALACVRGIPGRGRVPLLVGGTGLYLRALSLPLTLGNAPAAPQARERYRDYLLREGREALHALLAARDPDTAARLHPNDTRRVIRALEVLELTGVPLSRQRLPSEADSPFRFLLFAPLWQRETLYRRAAERAGRMIAAGLADEVKGLLDAGVPPDAQSMQGLGYKELLPCLRGDASLDEAREALVAGTCRYIKRQLTWFRGDGRVRWLDAEGAGPDALCAQMLRAVKEEGC